MGDMDRILNAFLDGNIDPKTLEYYLSPDSPYYDEWEEEQRRKKEEEATYKRPTGIIGKFAESKWSPSRGIYMDSDMPPVTGEWAQGGQDYIRERVKPPLPDDYVPDPYGFDKIPELLDKFKMVDTGRLERQAAESAAQEEQRRAGFYDPTASSGQVPQQQFQDMGFVGPPQPGENERAALMWKQFQEMNPNLDYDAVVRQAGGIPGSFDSPMISEMPESDKQKEQVQSLFDFVNNQVPQYEAQRMLDSRSRAYNPEAAQMLLDMASNNKRDAAYELMQRSQMLKSEAEMEQIKYTQELINQGMIPSGIKEPRQQGPNIMDEIKALDKLASEVFDMNQDVTPQEILAIKGALSMGNTEKAKRLLAKYVPELGMNPDYAGLPPGVAELAAQEGGIATGPNGEMVFVR